MRPTCVAVFLLFGGLAVMFFLRWVSSLPPVPKKKVELPVCCDPDDCEKYTPLGCCCAISGTKY